MTRFLDLLTEQYRLPAEEREQWVTSQLEQLFSGSVLNAWHLGDPVPTTGCRILIGIVSWSGYDLRLLDALRQADTVRGQGRIDVLDIEAAARSSGSYDYFERVIPGIGKIYQTPIVGIWNNGALMQRGSGAAGRELIIDRYNLNRGQILAPL